MTDYAGTDADEIFVLTEEDGSSTVDGGGGSVQLYIDWSALPGGATGSWYGQSGSLDNADAGFTVSFSSIEATTIYLGADRDVFTIDTFVIDTFGMASSIELDFGDGFDAFTGDFSARTSAMHLSMSDDVQALDGDGIAVREFEDSTITTGSGDDTFSLGIMAGASTVLDAREGDDVLTVDWSGSTTRQSGSYNGSDPLGASSTLADQGAMDADGNSSAQSIGFSGIETIDIKFGSGDDSFDVTVPTVSGAIDLGSGADNFSGYFAELESALDMTITDGVIALASAVTALTVSGAETYAVHSGSGDDNLVLTAAPVSVASNSVDGDTGTDTLTYDGSNGTDYQYGTFRESSGYGTFYDSATGGRGVAYRVESLNVTFGSGNDGFSVSGENGAAVGTHSFDLGLGDDYFDAWFADATADITLATTVDGFTLSGGGTTTLKNVERVFVKTGVGDDSLTGGDGADELAAGGGVNTLNGGGGDDRIVTTGGVDTIDGGDGYDSISIEGDSAIAISDDGTGPRLATGGSIANVEVIGFAGITDDTVVSASGDAIAYDGGIGDDAIVIDWSRETGSAYYDLIGGTGSGRRGDGSSGGSFSNFETATIKMGSGDDRVATYYTPESAVVLGHFDGGAGFDEFVGDYAQATAAISFVLDPAGARTTVNGIGDTVEQIERVSITTGSGDDTLTGGILGDILRAGGGVNTLSGGEGDDVFESGHYNNGLNSGVDTIDGGDGTDTWAASFGASPDAVTMTRTAENAYSVSNGSSAINVERIQFYGSNQNDVLLGGALGDLLDGGYGNDLLDSGAGDDFLDGGYGNDLLDGGAGDDRLGGGSGDDVYIVDSAGDKVIEFEGGGIDTVRASISYTLRDALADPFAGGQYIENVELTGTAYEAIGNSADNSLTGNAVANRLDGGAGADRMVGSAGDDVYYVDNAGDRVIETAAQGNDTIYSSVSYSLAGQFVETLALTGSAAINATGNLQANILIGNEGDNVLQGGANGDRMTGGLGDDTYYVDDARDRVIEANGQGTDTVISSISYSLAGQFVERLTLGGAAAINGTGNSLVNEITGNDAANRLTGEGGNDRLFGGGGADSLRGGLGDDELSGGAGSDRFVFDTQLGALNVDTVLDFSAVDDSFYLDDAMFSAAGPIGRLSGEAFHVGSAAHDDSDRIIFNSATGDIFYDADGSGVGAALLFAKVTPGLKLTNADFFVF